MYIRTIYYFFIESSSEMWILRKPFGGNSCVDRAGKSCDLDSKILSNALSDEVLRGCNSDSEKII